MGTESIGDSALSALSYKLFNLSQIRREQTRGPRSNQLNYVPTRQINEMRNRQCLRGFARITYIANPLRASQIAFNQAKPLIKSRADRRKIILTASSRTRKPASPKTSDNHPE